jgi:hypothetical protein
MRTARVETVLTGQLAGSHVLQAGEILERHQLDLGRRAGAVHQRRLFNLLGGIVGEEEERYGFVVILFVRNEA